MGSYDQGRDLILRLKIVWGVGMPAALCTGQRPPFSTLLTFSHHTVSNALWPKIHNAASYVLLFGQNLLSATNGEPWCPNWEVWSIGGGSGRTYPHQRTNIARVLI